MLVAVAAGSFIVWPAAHVFLYCPTIKLHYIVYKQAIKDQKQELFFPNKKIITNVIHRRPHSSVRTENPTSLATAPAL